MRSVMIAPPNSPREAPATVVTTGMPLKRHSGQRNGQSDAGGDEKALDIAVLDSSHVFFLSIGLAAPSGASDRTNTLPGRGKAQLASCK